MISLITNNIADIGKSSKVGIRCVYDSHGYSSSLDSNDVDQ